MEIHKGQSVTVHDLPHRGEQLQFLWVEAGAFTMGSPPSEARRSEDERQFVAKFSQGFWLSKNPVTQHQWQAVMNSNPSHFQGNGGDRPVENVNWYEAMEFCRRLNSASYILLPNGYAVSLPTEAQWEYACRAGTTTKYFFGEDESELDRFAWYAGNSNNETHPVGLKEANPWGFHDMYGNVFEWCYDEFADYPLGEATDWIGYKDANHPLLRIPDTRRVRGSCYCTVADQGDFRSAGRLDWPPEAKRRWSGFRVAIRMAPGG
jgi:formylglycine-generating enzyme required for sulfatase activity